MNWGWPWACWVSWRLKEKVVTGDALYCQRELSLRVQEQSGDYFWTLKDNQPGMREGGEPAL